MGKENFGDDDKFDWTYTIIHYEIYDGRIRHGTTCTDYSRLQSSYKDCVLKAIHQYLIEKIGCILPFATLQSKDRDEFICRENGNVIDQDKWNILQAFLVSFINEMDGGYLHQCLPPCTTYKVKIIETDNYSNAYEQARLSYFFEDYIDVYTEMYSYDIFSLVVDLGSALGLWLGVSAICILDNIFIVWNVIVKWSKRME